MPILTLEEAEALGWVTYGKGVVEDYTKRGIPLPDGKLVRLGNCSTGHLESILETQKHLDSEYTGAIKMILEHRLKIDEKIRRRDAVEATKAKYE